jgi:peroxiredoxin family protein
MNRQKRHDLVREWESWEHLITDDLRRLEYRIQACYSAMTILGIKREDREAYVTERIRELILQIASEGEKDNAKSA